MRRVILFVVLLVLSVWLGIVLTHDPGLALFYFHGVTVQAPLWFAVVCLLLLIFLAWQLARLVGAIDHSLYRWRAWMRWRSQARSATRINRGLLALMTGNWRIAERELTRGATTETLPVCWLGAAKAAHAQDELTQRDIYLQKVPQTTEEVRLATGLLQAKMARADHQYEQALAILRQLQERAPNNVQVLKQLYFVYQAQMDWEAQAKLVPQLTQAKVFNKKQLAQRSHKIYREWLKSVAAHAANSEVLQNAWRSLPRQLRQENTLIRCYARLLAPFPAEAESVADLVAQGMAISYDAALVKLLGQLKMSSPERHLARAEKWLQYYPDEPVLLLVLGQLCLQCQYWGKARAWFANCLAHAALPEAYAGMARVAEHANDEETARNCYRDGLAAATGMSLSSAHHTISMQ